MSRISNRIATISAALGIVLLVILLVILWSNVRNVDRIGDVGRTRNDSTVDRIVAIDEAREKQTDSVAWITTTLDSIEQNFTNEGKSYFSILDNFDKNKLHFNSNFKHAKIQDIGTGCNARDVSIQDIRKIQKCIYNNR